MSDIQSDQEPFLAGTKTVGNLFNTPLTVWKFSWLPVTQLVTWIILTRNTSKQKPHKSPLYWSTTGVFKMIAMLGSEWCHNLAHAFTANLVGKPMDQMRIQAGMPRCIYTQLNDQEVTPRQHIIRSLGGPIFNLVMLPITAFLRLITKPNTIAGETANTAFQTNLFLSTISLLPIPGIDGGPILKWSLVDKGYEIKEADLIVQKINGPLAVFLGIFSSRAFYKKKILAGVFSGLLGLISLSIFAGWLKEEDVSV